MSEAKIQPLPLKYHLQTVFNDASRFLYEHDRLGDRAFNQMVLGIDDPLDGALMVADRLQRVIDRTIQRDWS